jgi:hypothetical protein
MRFAADTPQLADLKVGATLLAVETANLEAQRRLYTSPKHGASS